MYLPFWLVQKADCIVFYPWRLPRLPNAAGTAQRCPLVGGGRRNFRTPDKRGVAPPAGGFPAPAAQSPHLVWKILRMEEPGRLQSMGSQRIEQDLSNFMMCVCTYICVQYKYTHLYLYRHPFQNFCILIDIFYMKGHYSLGIFQFFRYDLH